MRKASEPEGPPPVSGQTRMMVPGLPGISLALTL